MSTGIQIYRHRRYRNDRRENQPQYLVCSFSESLCFSAALLGIIAVWLSYDRFSTRLMEKSVTKTLVKNNFMVYLLHEPLMHIIFMSTVTYCKSDIVHMLLYFVLPVIRILLCVYIGKLLRSKCPKLNNILTGGR